mgnify:FL=1
MSEDNIIVFEVASNEANFVIDGRVYIDEIDGEDPIIWYNKQGLPTSSIHNVYSAIDSTSEKGYILDTFISDIQGDDMLLQYIHDLETGQSVDRGVYTLTIL